MPASAVLTFICFVYNGWIEIEFLMDAKRKLQKEWKRLCQPNRARVKSDCKPHAAADAPLAETTLKTEPSITAFFSENAGRNFTEAETRSVRPTAALSIYLSNFCLLCLQRCSAGGAAEGADPTPATAADVHRSVRAALQSVRGQQERQHLGGHLRIASDGLTVRHPSLFARYELDYCISIESFSER